MPALSSDPLDILIASDAWWTRILLEKCKEAIAALRPAKAAKP